VTETFPYRVGILQRVLTPYRAPLFDALADRCAGGVTVLAGKPARGETLATTDQLKRATLVDAHNRHLFRGPLGVYWQGGVRAWLDDTQPEILVAEANPRGLATGSAVRWMHRRWRPVVGWGLGAQSLTPRLGRARAARRRQFLGRFDGMIAYSSRAAAQYVAVGFPEDRVFVCANAVAPRPTSLPPEREASFGKAPIVLFVGRLTSAKRVDVLVRACAVLARTVPELAPVLRIVGDGEARSSVEELAHHTYPATQFVGAMQGGELAAQFRSADVFVLPNLGGLAIQEAMSHGLPIVVGAGDGSQVDLVREENGWHVTPGDADQLASTLRHAFSDVTRLRVMGSASFRIVAEEINLDTMVDEFIGALNRVHEQATRAANAG
jgi:glycosyltransferase involved in cell wall biosynthesis